MVCSKNLNSRLNELVNIEKELWRAFHLAEKEYAPPIFRIDRAFVGSFDLVRHGHLKWYINYPALFLCAMLSALITPIYHWAFISYCAFLLATFIARSEYVNAYTSSKLDGEKYAKHGFGLDNLSLVIVGVINLYKVENTKLSKQDILSIAKIVKSSQEHSEVTFGVTDQIKRAFLASMIPFAYWMLINRAVVSEYYNKAVLLLTQNASISVFLSGILIGLSALMFDLLYGQTYAKRQKKKYLLLLNIIGESLES